MYLNYSTPSKQAANTGMRALCRAFRLPIVLLSLATASYAADDSGETSAATAETAWNTYCVSCHAGAMLEAPRQEALSLLEPSAIVTSLESGIMSTIGLALSRDEKEDLAYYLTGKEVSDSVADLSEHYCGNSTSDSNTLAGEAPVWGSWSGSDGLRFAAEESVLTPTNVESLSLKWAFAFPGATRVRAQPTLGKRTLFMGSQSGTIYALDRETGCIRWEFKADSEVRGAINLASDEQQAATLYFGDFKAQTYALDASTGKLRWKTRVHEHPMATITGSVTSDDQHVYVPVSSSEVVPAAQSSYSCCTFRGAIVALKLADGSKAWEYFTTDEPKLLGKNGAGADRFGPSGAPIWSSPTVDSKRGAVVVTTGQNYSSPATGTSDAVISLDADDGSVRWVQQVTANDAWNGACSRKTANCPEEDGPDFDIGASAVIVNRDDKDDLIFAGQKSGMTYAINADSGEMVWQQRVGSGGTMGGVHWGMSSDGARLYVGVSDQPTGNKYTEGPPRPGVNALNLDSGKFIWRFDAPNRCPAGVPFLCHNGVSAAVSSSTGLVFAGAMDGWFRVLDSTSGELLWEINTARNFDTVNGVSGRGGAIESDGPVIADGEVYLTSGYDKWGEFPGNVLLVFALPELQ